MEKFDVAIWGTVGQWISITATFMVAVIALLKEEIIRTFRHSDLRIAIRPNSSDCHKTTIYFNYENRPRSSGIYYFRLWVENVGSLRAEKVQVFIAKLEKKRLDNTFEEVRSFLPMNLRWSQSGGTDKPEVFADGISSRMGKHCDIAHIVSPFWKSVLGESLPSEEENATAVCALEVEVPTNTRTHLLAPGTYRLALRIAASNTKPIERVLEIGFTGEWSDDETLMLNQKAYAKVVG